MADPARLLGGGVAAALFGVYADLAYNAYSATNSSPQTTELFASERSDTLWKYVRLGGVQILALGIFGTLVAGSLWPLLGVLSVGAARFEGVAVHEVHGGAAHRVPLAS